MNFFELIFALRNVVFQNTWNFAFRKCCHFSKKAYQKLFIKQKRKININLPLRKILVTMKYKDHPILQQYPHKLHLEYWSA